jgi:hypothetical protein
MADRVTIYGEQFEILEWNYQDENADGEVTWHLYARRVRKGENEK